MTRGSLNDEDANHSFSCMAANRAEEWVSAWLKRSQHHLGFCLATPSREVEIKVLTGRLEAVAVAWPVKVQHLELHGSTVRDADFCGHDDAPGHRDGNGQRWVGPEEGQRSAEVRA